MNTYFNKFRSLPESLKKLMGLIFITIIIIISFSILNTIFGQGDELVKKMKLEEERIAKEKKTKRINIKITIWYFGNI